MRRKRLKGTEERDPFPASTRMNEAPGKLCIWVNASSTSREEEHQVAIHLRHRYFHRSNVMCEAGTTMLFPITLTTDSHIATVRLAAQHCCESPLAARKLQNRMCNVHRGRKKAKYRPKVQPTQPTPDLVLETPLGSSKSHRKRNKSKLLSQLIHPRYGSPRKALPSRTTLVIPGYQRPQQ